METKDEDFDTEMWRKVRDEKLSEWVGDANAVSYLLMLGDVCEMFDDLIDRDKPIDDATIVRVLASVLIFMPTNPFFCQNSAVLRPLLISSMNAWLDANVLERGSDTDKSRAYVLRDSMVEIIIFCIGLTKGYDEMRRLSLSVRAFLLHETLDQYKEKLQ